jgi:hypothetical protein
MADTTAALRSVSMDVHPKSSTRLEIHRCASPRSNRSSFVFAAPEMRPDDCFEDLELSLSECLHESLLGRLHVVHAKRRYRSLRVFRHVFQSIGEPLFRRCDAQRAQRRALAWGEAFFEAGR